jgi:hypothetical protein
MHWCKQFDIITMIPLKKRKKTDNKDRQQKYSSTDKRWYNAGIKGNREEKMFKRNESHRQKELFGIENRLPEKMRKRLKGTIYPLFYEEVFCKIDEDLFSDMYSEKVSRPNVPVNIFVGLEILKHLLDLTDEELFENFYLDMRYKVAFGIQDIAGGDISIRSFYNFRRRVVAYIAEKGENPFKEVFEDLTANFIAKAGVKTDIIRMDSTQITSNMKRLTRIEVMSRTLSKFLKTLPCEEIENHAKAYAPYLEEGTLKEYLETIPEPRLSLSAIAKDVRKILKRYKQSDGFGQNKAWTLLERVLKDQTIIVEGQLVVKAGKDIASDSCQSPHDEEATYRKKKGKGYSGYSANITETANPDNDVQMVTNVHTENNIHSDEAFLKEEFEELTDKTDMELLIVDGGYANDDNREMANKAGVELVETGLKGRKPKHDSTAFEIDDEGIKRCPTGKTPLKTQIKSGKAQALFSHDDCDNCPLRQHCLVKKQKKGMKADIDLKRHEKDKQRALMHSQAFKEKKNLRSAIEGTISAMKRTGLNRIKVFGHTRVSLDVICNAIGTNFKRLFRVEQNKLKNRQSPLTATICAA